MLEQEVKVYTLEDLNRLRGVERFNALLKWREHNKKCWKEARKEMKSMADKVRYFKYRKEGKCHCSRQLTGPYVSCDICREKDKKRRQKSNFTSRTMIKNETFK